jgi:hypothetical protein
MSNRHLASVGLMAVSFPEVHVRACLTGSESGKPGAGQHHLKWITNYI